MASPLTDYTPEIAYAARGEGLDVDLVTAIVLVESSGRTNAYRYEPDYYDKYLRNNPAYAGMVPRRCAASYGLMQVMYPTARQYGFAREPEYLFVPTIGLEFGCKHLRKLLTWSRGNVEQAVGAYNTGQGKRPDGTPGWDSAAGQTYRTKVRAALARVIGAPVTVLPALTDTPTSRTDVRGTIVTGDFGGHD